MSASFQPTDVGKLIRIGGTIYRIATRVSATSVTLDRAVRGGDHDHRRLAVYDDADEHGLGALDRRARGRAHLLRDRL